LKVGVVFNPILNELYHAVRGGGAFLNGAPITVSDTALLRHAVVATEMGTRRDDGFIAACFDRMQALGRAARSLRCSGSCALNLCSVAMGRCVGEGGRVAGREGTS
jgi:inositol-phosphate phosphatase/L-galactose 1-phosphate phosphatase